MMESLCCTADIGTTLSLNSTWIEICNNCQKWIKTLDVKPQMTKPLEENLKENLLDLSSGNDFLDMKPKRQGPKAKRKKWYL